MQNQIENCISFINAKGISVDSIYSDIKSGMSLDRKGFIELLNAVMAFKIKAVLYFL
nr:recombinase family protein [Helicobacter pylori]